MEKVEIPEGIPPRYKLHTTRCGPGYGSFWTKTFGEDADDGVYSGCNVTHDANTQYRALELARVSVWRHHIKTREYKLEQRVRLLEQELRMLLNNPRTSYSEQITRAIMRRLGVREGQP